MSQCLKSSSETPATSTNTERSGPRSRNQVSLEYTHLYLSNPKTWQQEVQNKSFLMLKTWLNLQVRLRFPGFSVGTASSSASSSPLARLLGPMWFPEVNKGVSGLWDGSEGSDWGVADPDRWSAASLLLIVVIQQINDFSNTRTQTPVDTLELFECAAKLNVLFFSLPYLRRLQSNDQDSAQCILFWK